MRPWVTASAARHRVVEKRKFSVIWFSHCYLFARVSGIILIDEHDTEEDLLMLYFSVTNWGFLAHGNT